MKQCWLLNQPTTHQNSGGGHDKDHDLLRREGSRGIDFEFQFSFWREEKVLVPAIELKQY